MKLSSTSLDEGLAKRGQQSCDGNELELNEPLVRLLKMGVLNTNGLELLNLPLTISGINEPIVVY
jgi:hypothetical protein